MLLALAAVRVLVSMRGSEASGASRLRTLNLYYIFYFVLFKTFGNNAIVGGTRVGFHARYFGFGRFEATRIEPFNVYIPSFGIFRRNAKCVVCASVSKRGVGVL